MLRKKGLQDQGDKEQSSAEQRFQDQAVDAQKERNREKIPGSGGDASKGLGSVGQKNRAEKRFQDQAVAVERKTPGSEGHNSGAEKRFQDQAVNAEKKI